MQLKCVTYTSLAALDLDEDQLRAIHGAARDLNGIDGISGLLVFNGTHFLQWIEGPPESIDELIERLRRDPRHTGFEIRDERFLDRRMFGDWTMRLVRVRSNFQLAQDDVALQLPGDFPDHLRERVMGMVEKISEDVEL
jgi:hypothetical protein